MKKVAYVGIDLSTTSTGVFIRKYDDNGEKIEKCLVFGEKSIMDKYMNIVEPITEFYVQKFQYPSGNSEKINYSIEHYDYFCKNVVAMIKKQTEDYSVHIAIESFGYGTSQSVSMLIMLGTLMRKRLSSVFQRIENVEPTKLKSFAGKIYPIINKSHRNNAGISAGRFTKRDMLTAFLDTVQSQEKWKGGFYELIISNISTITATKQPKSPINDLIDAEALARFIEEKNVSFQQFLTKSING